MTPPKRLLCVTTYTGMGGGETSLLTLMEHLDPSRYLPSLLTPQPGELPRRFAAHGWNTHVLPYRGASVWFMPALYARFPIVEKMTRLFREQADLVHSDYHSLPFVLPAAQRAGIPVVWTCWGWWFHPKFWQRHFFKQPALGFAASWAIQEGFLGKPPFMPPEKLPVLPPGIDTERFQPEVDGRIVRDEAGVGDAPLAALIARFQNVKGHDVFQAMVRRVAAVIPEARFIVSGENVHGVSADDEYKRRILHAAETDPVLRERLIYLGFRPDVERVMAAADVIVCPSHFESYGMVNVEAMASGKPVVSTRRGGPSETVVHGETGYLVDAGDDAALAEYVIKLLHDPALRTQMGAAGRARVLNHFSAHAMAKTFTQAVDGILPHPK